jgi:hypothetical protein
MVSFGLHLDRNSKMYGAKAPKTIACILPHLLSFSSLPQLALNSEELICHPTMEKPWISNVAPQLPRIFVNEILVDTPSLPDFCFGVVGFSVP